MGKRLAIASVPGVMKQLRSVASSGANAVEAKAGPAWLKRVGRSACQSNACVSSASLLAAREGW